MRRARLSIRSSPGMSSEDYWLSDNEAADAAAHISTETWMRILGGLRKIPHSRWTKTDVLITCSTIRWHVQKWASLRQECTLCQDCSFWSSP